MNGGNNHGLIRNRNDSADLHTIVSDLESHNKSGNRALNHRSTSNLGLDHLESFKDKTAQTEVLYPNSNDAIRPETSLNREFS